MINALQFDYVNHNNEQHNYKVIPIDFGWERCKCFPHEPEREAWVMRALVIERSGEVRAVKRSFALVKMTNIIEVPLPS